MEKKQTPNESGVFEPQITSPDPTERIAARRLRIQKRSLATRKRLLTLEEGKGPMEDEAETVVEKQVEKSTIELLTLAHEGEELITNVRVAADAYEVKRRCDQAAAKEARLKKLEDEANIAQEKFNKINSKWENISSLIDPLDLHQETEMQREKCADLIAQKDQLISELKVELKEGDIRFIKDQEKQAADISLLVERVDNQIAVMRRAYRHELTLIEKAIDLERSGTMELNNRQWEQLYKQREEDEISNLEQRFVALSEHNELMQSILIHHQEKFRATKISLEKDIQVLQQQLEQVKAICLLNKEKMEYNYQVLKKRDEESLLIRSQQKRRINKLQDIVTTLRRKLVAMEQNTQAEVKRLTSEVIKLHRNIKDIRLKADHFCSVNQTKYFQLWKFNHDSAQKLLDKILSIDQLVYEQHLGIPWEMPSPEVINKQDLPSYRHAVAQQSNTHPEYSKTLQTTNQSLKDKLAGERLLQCILQAVADRSGFLVEDRLTILLAPYTSSQNTLVRIDNVFSALGVSRQEDMQLLRQTMEPYIVCVTCQPILEGIHPVSPPPMPALPLQTEEEVKIHAIKKVKDYMEEAEKHTTLKTSSNSELRRHSEPPIYKMSTSSYGVSQVDSTVSPWMALSTYEASPPPTVSQLDMKSVAPSTFTLVFSSRKPANPTPDSSITTIPDTHSTSLDGSETYENRATPGTEIEQAEDEVHDPSHIQSINPVYVLKALQEFVQKFQAIKHSYEGPLWGEKVEEKKSISRQISNSDVRKYWQQFRDAFPPEKEKLWDCLYMGLQQYHSVLQERHRINSEIEQLKVQNADLRRLLQKYALPNNMKPTKGPRQSLPPLLVKTPTAPTPTAARLVLTFNNATKM